MTTESSWSEGERLIRYLLQHETGEVDELYARSSATTALPRYGEYVSLDGQTHFVQSVEHRHRPKAQPDRIDIILACAGREVFDACTHGCGLENHPVFGEQMHHERFHRRRLGLGGTE